MAEPPSDGPEVAKGYHIVTCANLRCERGGGKRKRFQRRRVGQVFCCSSCRTQAFLAKNGYVPKTRRRPQ